MFYTIADVWQNLLIESNPQHRVWDHLSALLCSSLEAHWLTGNVWALQNPAFCLILPLLLFTFLTVFSLLCCKLNYIISVKKVIDLASWSNNDIFVLLITGHPTDIHILLLPFLNILLFTQKSQLRDWGRSQRFQGTPELKGGSKCRVQEVSSPFFSLASPTSSQRLSEARYRQDNHHLIRDFIGSRLVFRQ